MEVFDQSNVRSNDLLYPEESYKIVGACREVYKQFGGSFKESVVDKSLAVALEKQGLKVDSQKRIDIYFQDVKVGVYVLDKIVNDIIVLEVKCKPFLVKEDEKQFWRYLTATEYKLGFLVNFGTQKLEIRRRVYDLARNNSRLSSQN